MSRIKEDLNMDLLIKRRSFHKFNEVLPINDDELSMISSFCDNVTPLFKDIKFHIELVDETKINDAKGASHGLIFYSEKKDNYLLNIGYIGEQIDLFLQQNNFGTLWYGFGRDKSNTVTDLDFVIILLFSKVDPSSFRKDISEFKRKDLSSVIKSDNLSFLNQSLLAPSACNTSPYFINGDENKFEIYKTKNGLALLALSKRLTTYFNFIDVGIFLYYVDYIISNKQLKYKKEFHPYDINETKDQLIVTYRKQ